MILSEAGTLAVEAGAPHPARRVVLLECLPDRPPELLVGFPPPLLVACGGSTVPIEIDARDDLGLADVSLVIGDQDDHEVREALFFAEGKKRLAVTESLVLTSDSAPVYRVRACATDRRRPLANRTEADSRTVRVVSPETFRLLRRLDGIEILRQRLMALRADLVEILRRAGPPDGEPGTLSIADARAVLDLLRGVRNRLTELEEDPVFSLERRFSTPVVERSSGLRELILAEVPATEAERRAWLSLIRYFARELVDRIGELLPETNGLAEAQPFLRDLAEALRLPARQEAVVEALGAGGELAGSREEERRIHAAVLRLGATLAATVPAELGRVASQVERRLRNPLLAAALEGAVAALDRGERADARRFAERAIPLLRPLRDAILGTDRIAELSLADVLDELARGLKARDRLYLASDRFLLWGPGAETDRRPPEPPPPGLSGTVLFTAGERPSLVTDREDVSGTRYYRPLVQWYEKAYERLRRTAPPGRDPAGENR